MHSIHTIQALSKSYLISHIDTFHTPYRVSRDQFPRLAVYTKHPSMIQPTEKPSKEPDKNASVGSELFFSRLADGSILLQINALRHHTPAEPWNHRKFRVRSTRGRNQNSTNNGYPRAVPGYINHGTIGKDQNPHRFFFPVHHPGVHCNMVLMYVVRMREFIFSSAPLYLIVFRSTVRCEKKMWRNCGCCRIVRIPYAQRG